MRWRGLICVTLPNSQRSVKPLWGYSDLLFFQYGGRLSSWICCTGDWTTHERRLVVFITVQKLVVTPIYTRFGVFGAYFPKMKSLIVLTAKRTALGRNHVIWAIKRECRPRDSSWALYQEKGQYMQGRKKSHKRVIHSEPQKTWQFIFDYNFGSS